MDQTAADQKQIRAKLERILESEQFSDSEQLSNFLTYVVSKTLNGEESDIKAYTIAVDALGRSEKFDPQNNAIVRVTAGRLRQALALYYAQHDDGDEPVKITLEPGSYVPSFEVAGQTNLPAPQTNNHTPLVTQPNVFRLKPTSRAIWGLGLALLTVGLLLVWNPFSQTGKERAAGKDALFKSAHAEVAPVDKDVRPKIVAAILLPDESYPKWININEAIDSISDAISRFDDYQFLGTLSGKELPTDNKMAADYTLLTTIHNLKNDIRVFGKLVRETDGTVIWSAQALVKSPDASVQLDIPKMVGQALSPVGSPYGIIFSDLHKMGNNRPELKCYVLAYGYFIRKSDETYDAARSCAQTHVDNGSRLPSLYALLTFLLLDEIREGHDTNSNMPLVAAQNAARKALELGPQSARAHQALFGVQKVQGNYKMALNYGQRAIELNPFDTDILGDFAAWQISIGNIAEGKVLLERAKELLSAPPAWFEVFQFLAADLDDETSGDAPKLTQLMDPSRSPMTAFCVVIGAHRQNDLARMNFAMGILKNSFPGMVKNPKDNLLQRGFSNALAVQLTAKFNAAEKFIQDNQQN